MSDIPELPSEQSIQWEIAISFRRMEDIVARALEAANTRNHSPHWIAYVVAGLLLVVLALQALTLGVNYSDKDERRHARATTFQNRENDLAEQRRWRTANICFHMTGKVAECGLFDLVDRLPDEGVKR